MIEEILNLIPGNELEIGIMALSCFILSISIAQVIWSDKIKKRDAQIKNLENSLEKKDTIINNIKLKAQELLSQNSNEIEQLNNQLKNSERILEEKEKRTNILNTQLANREKNVIEITKQLEQKNETINNLKKQVEDLSKINKDALTRVEFAEAKVDGLEKILEAKKNEATSLSVRIKMMQDDFTQIYGIEPKVSSALRSKGINTFAELASTKTNKIIEILKDENPSLLRLTDPTTWAEQAQLASIEEWEALQALQESLKKRQRAYKKSSEKYIIMIKIISLMYFLPRQARQLHDNGILIG